MLYAKAKSQLEWNAGLDPLEFSVDNKFLRKT